MNAPFHWPGRWPGGATEAPRAAPDPLSPELKRYLRRAQSRAGALLSRAGVDITAYAVAVRAAVSLAGNVMDVEVVRSSGSTQVDAVIEAVLLRILRSDPPAGLIGGAITLRLGPTPGAAAKAS